MYLVFAGQKIDEYTPERDVKDMGWFTTVKDVADGQFENMTRVIEVGTGRDVTHMIVRGAMNIWANNGEPLTRWQRQFIELHVSVSAANRFLQAAE